MKRSISSSRLWVFPTEEYRHAEISLIDGNGNYIIKGKSFKNSSFFEFYKSYNSTDYARQSELEAEFISKAGALTMFNSTGQECLITYSPVNSTEDWTIVSYILTENLRQSSIDWLMLAVSAALVFLLLFDLLAMLSFNRALQKTARQPVEIGVPVQYIPRNPAILGMNEMIQRESEDENVLEYSDTIQTAGVSLLGIISDILDFSKIEAGRMELFASDYSLSGMVSDLINLNFGTLKERRNGRMDSCRGRRHRQFAHGGAYSGLATNAHGVHAFGKGRPPLSGK